MATIRNIVILSIATLLCCCNSRPQHSDKDTTLSAENEVSTIHYDPGTRRMKRHTENVHMIRTPEEFNTMVEHYWDDFDFDAGERVSEYDTIDIVYAMSDYVLYIPPYKADSLLRALMLRASTSREMLSFFSTITEMVLHDPNSPMRNDEYYIPVLETLLASPLLDEYDRIAPAYDLEIALKNRVGRAANDFTYTLQDGRSACLYDIDSEFVILMFSNPGCPMCGDIIAQLSSSGLINQLQQLGLIKLLSIYPDADIEAWRDHLGDMPEEWINGYDKGMVISAERLYNLNAIPSLYLLDREKRVLIKDGSSVASIENRLMHILSSSPRN